jgi:hypothetical protein
VRTPGRVFIGQECHGASRGGPWWAVDTDVVPGKPGVYVRYDRRGRARFEIAYRGRPVAVFIRGQVAPVAQLE